MSISQVLTALDSKKSGLISLAAKKRLFLHGKNEIKSQGQNSAWTIFLSQFKSPLVLILLLASLLAGFLGEVISTVIIVLIILMSALLGFSQEYKSEKIIRVLFQLTIIADNY